MADLELRSRTDRLAGLRVFFESLVTWAGSTPHVRTDASDVVVRLHQDAASGALYLWALNPARSDRDVRLCLAERWGTPTAATPVWAGGRIEVRADGLCLTVGARDAVLARLDFA
jgi:hypothetical protein